MQVGTADRLLGRLFDRLRSVDEYERAMIVVAADHGVSFQPGTYRRGNPRHASFYQDIMQVPLFVKMPFQSEGRISERNVQTIDVLPTIAQALQIEVSWEIDGISMFAEKRERGAHKQVFIGRVREAGDLKNDGGQELAGQLLSFEMPRKYPRETLDWKLALEGYKNPPPGNPFYLGPHADEIGKALSGFTIAAPSSIRFKLGNRGGLAPDSGRLVYAQKGGFCPCRIYGKLEDAESVAPGAQLALSLNGVVQGFPRVFSVPDGGKEFNVFVPEGILVPGENEVALFLVQGRESGRITLVPINQQDAGGPAR